MKRTIVAASSLGAALILLAPFAAFADTAPLVAVCSGSASSSSIAWSASATGGVSPIAFLWGNGATSATQTLTYQPGTYTMTLQATDASSTVATTSCSATVASSTSSTGSGSLLAQIQALLAQIAALKQQVAALTRGLGGGFGDASTTPSVGHPGCPVPNRNLGIGDRGDDVKELQQFLATEDPETFASSSATGFFGPLTVKAMKHFQEHNGIASTTTGFVGPLTRGFLGKHCGEIEGLGHLKGTASDGENKPPRPGENASTTSDHGGNGQGEDGNNNSDH